MRDIEKEAIHSANVRLLANLVHDLSEAIAQAAGDEHRIAVAEYAFQQNLSAMRSARERNRRLAA